MNEHFSIQRTWWLLRADLAGGYRSLFMVSATLAGAILLISLLSFDGDTDVRAFFVSAFGAILFVWGAIASSHAFRELHDKSRNEAYLMTPASAIEKTLARLLTTTVGLTAYLLIFTTAVSVVVAGVHLLLPNRSLGLFNPMDPDLLPRIAAYLILQSFFFLGAAWFRKRHFIKTALALSLAAIGLIVLLLLMLGIVFDPVGLVDLDVLAETAAGSYQDLMRLFATLRTIFLIMLVLLPVACWTIAWLRVRETQVSDGV